MKFNRELDFTYGEADELAPGLRRVIARNPGPFTFHGTGTYIIGRGEVAIIDPGPLIDDHLAAILAATKGERITHIFVTHTHGDHAPLAAPLKKHTDAIVLGCAPAPAAIGPSHEEEHDIGYCPDRILQDGDRIEGPGWALEAVHTPGHTATHLCFAWAERNILFPGDHVMGWSTTIVSPPDGDMAAYMQSLDKLEARPESLYYPTHGAPIENAHEHIRALRQHRLQREAQLLDLLGQGISAIPAMVEAAYPDLPRMMHPAAERSVLAHLRKLQQEGLVDENHGAYTLTDAFRKYRK